jgi:hypothetical protein
MNGIFVIERLLENCPSKLCFLIHHDTHDHIVKMWSSFLNLYRFVTLEIHEFTNIEDIFEKCKGWVNDFLALVSLGRKSSDSVTPCSYFWCSFAYHSRSSLMSNVLLFFELARFWQLRPICLFLNDDFFFISS